MQTKLEIGTAVEFVSEVERYPHFVVPAGTTGTVRYKGPYNVVVKVDQRIKGLTDSKEWRGEVELESHELAEVLSILK